MKTRRYIAAVLLAGAILPAHSVTGGVPVIDITAITKAMEQVNNQLAMLKRMKSQIDEAIATKQALTGQRFVWGNLLNGADDKQMRRYLPENWWDIGSRIVAMNEYYRQVKSNYDRVKAQLYQSGTSAQVMPGQKPGSRTVALYDEARDDAAKHVAATQSAYGMVNKRLDKIEQLVAKVGTTGDLKDSADLNARIQAENALLVSDLTRLQAVHYTAQAQRESRDLEEDSAFKKFGGGSIPSIKGKY